MPEGSLSSPPSLADYEPHPRFAEAVAAIDAGDLAGLDALLAANPELVRARTNLDPSHGYFAGATLLHHVAWNPSRPAPVPGNIVAIARLLIDRGADVDAATLGTNGGSVMGLLLTSKQASDAGISHYSNQFVSPMAHSLSNFVSAATRQSKRPSKDLERLAHRTSTHLIQPETVRDTCSASNTCTI